jgi:hypothetical protein
MHKGPEKSDTRWYVWEYIEALSAHSNNYYMQRKLHELQQWKEEIITVGREEISALARCTRQCVQTVEKNVRFPSSPPRGDLFTVTSAFRNTGSPGTNLKNLKFLPYLMCTRARPGI